MPQSFLKKFTPLTASHSDERPFRSEILSRELLRIHAAESARKSGGVSFRTRSVPLKNKFRENCRSLNSVYFSLSDIASKKGFLAAGAEWLLDNYHVIDEQVREIRRDLPSSYYKALPRIAEDRWKGYPRVFMISCEFIEHTDSMIQLDTLSEYIDSFQEECPLNINELWAIPIMLRLALVENLKRLSGSVLKFSLQREHARNLFNKIVYNKDISATEILSQILLNVSPESEDVEILFPLLAARLRTLGSSSALGIQWLEEKAREKNVDLAAATKKQQQLQAADQISIGNAVTSLKNMGRLDWRSWVESQSVVNRILAKESSGIFSRSDFYTRDLIRHKIEDLSRKTKHEERYIAEQALILSDQAHDQSAPYRSHTGYYLIDEGIHELEGILRSNSTIRNKVSGFFRNKLFSYFLLWILTCTVGTAAYFSQLLSASSFAGTVFFFFLLLIPASQLAIEVIQWISSRIRTPEPLAKFDYEDSVPDTATTLVVVQAIISNKNHLLSTIDDLEIRAIGNKDPNIAFGILADLPDAASAEISGDSELLTAGVTRIRELTTEYAGEGIHFFIMFRERKWNESEQKYIGWERKRGKLIEFNRLLRGAEDTSFNIIEGDLNFLKRARYVITLDNDTQLPPGTAKKLIGCADHPLNIPFTDKEHNITRRGYGILQPRVGITLESATATLFSVLYSGQSGLDPYTRTISDIYQDVFGEASYIGKGIYHIDTFIQVLENRFPENSILSHDLLESGYVRCGLASDIEVFDEFPKRYHTYAKRQHRWIRGDWQLLPWLFSSTPVEKGYEKNYLTSLVRWKLFDNLRRSLLPISLFLLILTGALKGTLLPVLAVTFILTAFRAYSLVYTLLLQIPIGYSISTHFLSVLRDIKHNTLAWCFEIATLPHQASISLDASARTLYRTFVSKKNLLEWETAFNSELRLKPDIESFFRSMGTSSLIVVFVLLLSVVFIPSVVSFEYLLLLAVWALSPFVAWFISKDLNQGKNTLSSADIHYLDKVAHDTWRYFRNHLTEEYNYLIPDNIQLNPQEVVAERTSPTNISLSLLALTSSYDLGFIPSPVLLERSEKILSTVMKLERFHGHLLNWYSIRDLRPLHPRYVSSVDSGNFVGHVIVLREALRTLPYAPLINQAHEKTFSTHLKKTFQPPSDSINDILFNIVPEIQTALETNKQLNVYQLELLTDLSSILPYTRWISKLDILEELGRLHVLPKKLSRIREIIKNRPLTPFLAHKIVSRILASRDKIFIDTITKEQHLALEALFHDLEIARASIDRFTKGVDALCKSIDELVDETDFSFLYDEQKKLLAIGYNIENASLDSGSYDLLASEARLGSFVGIAKGDLPHVHWFFLGRALTESPGGKALISWSGTMFEYLMPILVMKNYPSTLLGKTYESVIKAQQSYCFRRGVPWGISESAYGIVDFENTYQYRAFGVPGLGLKRGLIEDLVISPYSSALALQITPSEATKNLHALETVGARGEYGFYEAIDYTPERLTSEETFHVIKSFFAHHQGMTLAAINNALNNNIIQERFHKDLRVQSCTLLLQERFPNRIPLILPHQAELLLIESVEGESRYATQEHFKSAHQPFPRTHLLSNGEYTVCIDHRGNGFSSFRNEYLANRFSFHTRYNSQGQYLYIRDEDKNLYWSGTYYPCKHEPDHYEVLFAPDKVEYQRRDLDIHTMTEVLVSPEDNLEIRKVSLTNHSGTRRKLSITSYLEVALASARADAAHPAFSKLFLETSWIKYPEAIFCKRRPRAGESDSPVLFHFSASEVVWEPTQYTTDRLEFVGRGNTLAAPEALNINSPLGKKTGYVLDPCACIRQIIELEAGQSASMYFVTGFADDEDEALYLCKKYKEIQSIRRTAELAWSHANVEQKNQQFLKSSTLDFQHLGNAILYPPEDLRDTSLTETPELSQTGLWKMGISGDEPIVLYYIDDISYVSHFQEMLLAHEFLRSRGIIFDLVVLNDKSDGYIQALGDELESSVRASLSAHLINERGGIFIRNRHHLSREDIELLRAAASLIMHATKGDLATQLDFKARRPAQKPALLQGNRLAPGTSLKKHTERKLHAPVIGSFSENGKAYEISVNSHSLPPLPWSNIIANPDIGFLVTETGAGYTWIGNSRENRVSVWSNDPVSDPHSEVLYIRDCETSSYWCPTPLPVRDDIDVQVTHQPGRSSFRKQCNGILSTLDTFVSIDQPNRYWLLSLENKEDKPRTLEVILYLEWVLGVSRSDSVQHLFTGVSEESGFIFAKNHWNEEFKGNFVYTGSSLPLQDYTTEQRNFLGYSSSLAAPYFLEQMKRDHDARIIKTRATTGSTLSRKTGFGFDSAAILKYEIQIPPKSSTRIAFYLGSADSVDAAKESAKSLNKLSLADKEREKADTFWAESLGTFQVESPDKAFDTIVNTWLPYQSLACRMYARTGFYQSSGAYGFRDQLQDSLAFLYTHPEITRKQILINCSRQFTEGDVQHWWHPPSGRGIRSRISDNYLWLPYALLEYLDTTGDASILDETAPYLSGPPGTGGTS
jgi:cyclic beta-1,2-glucan synthetase